MSKETGGPAFPCPPGFDNFQGMTLRDYFAAHAPDPTQEAVGRIMKMEQVANPHNEPYHNKVRRRSEMEIRCALRFEYADAMLAVRAKGAA